MMISRGANRRNAPNFARGTSLWRYVREPA
jgi:hypothetical protein